MTTKLDQSSAEHRRAKSTAASPLAPKISIFGAKAGFVIPKNKLAGSIVIRSTSAKNETPAASSEDSSRHVHRKTKWAPDLALDPVVCKGRALAYQVSYCHLSLLSFTLMGLCFLPALSFVLCTTTIFCILIDVICLVQLVPTGYIVLPFLSKNNPWTKTVLKFHITSNQKDVYLECLFLKYLFLLVAW